MKKNKVIIIIISLIIVLCISLLVVILLRDSGSKNKYIEDIESYDFVEKIGSIDILILEIDTLIVNDADAYLVELSRILDEIKVLDNEIGSDLGKMTVEEEDTQTHDLLISYHLKNLERISAIDKMISLYNEVMDTPVENTDEIRRIYEETISTMDDIVSLSSEADDFKNEWTKAYNIIAPVKADELLESSDAVETTEPLETEEPAVPDEAITEE
ncbi:MAG: hypothetical protein PF505_07800 [Vallitaleaceae bacterium]|jgi:hypothetical protein|nr:hypothetical protein [Vallitaleaceae bacterium]